MSDAALDTILDAARLAPSAGNSQPWAFVAGRRGDGVHGRIVAHLAGSSARWAPDASVLVVNLARVLVEDTDWEYSEYARYDLGQAVAHMTMQALRRSRETPTPRRGDLGPGAVTWARDPADGR